MSVLPRIMHFSYILNLPIKLKLMNNIYIHVLNDVHKISFNVLQIFLGHVKLQIYIFIFVQFGLSDVLWEWKYICSKYKSCREMTIRPWEINWKLFQDGYKILTNNFRPSSGDEKLNILVIHMFQSLTFLFSKHIEFFLRKTKVFFYLMKQLYFPKFLTHIS